MKSKIGTGNKNAIIKVTQFVDDLVTGDIAWFQVSDTPVNEGQQALEYTQQAL